MPQVLRHFDDTEAMIRALKPSYPVYCLRPEELKATAMRFLRSFPGRVLYAVKCNPHPAILRALHDAGIRHFDTASLAEIAQIRDLFPDAECYFMHPVKARAAILSAHEVYGVDHYVIDHRSELDKIESVVGGGDGQVMMVRLVTPQYQALYELSKKFGATPEEAVKLLRASVKAGFQVGLAFHVGSQIRDPRAYRDAIALVGRVVEEAGVDIHYLDVGGGFPAPYVDDEPPPQELFFLAIEEAVRSIPLRRDCVVMCEPGRALVASGMSLVTQVQLVKENAVYINDGIYHSLSEAVTGHVQLPVRCFRLAGEHATELRPYTIYGPTCDSTDVLPYPMRLPVDIAEGDWIEFGMVGAYSNALSTRFNGFYPEAYVTVADAPLLPDYARSAAA